jgi:hypothetical protein
LINESRQRASLLFARPVVSLFLRAVLPGKMRAGVVVVVVVVLPLRAGARAPSELSIKKLTKLAAQY